MILTPEQQAEAKALFMSYVQGCTPYVNEESFPGRIFWMKNQRYFFEYDKDFPDKFWIQHSIWVDFNKKFNLNYKQTSDLLKPLIEDAFKLGQFTPELSLLHRTCQIEAMLKFGQITLTTWTAIQEQKQSTEYTKDLADLAMSGNSTIQPNTSTMENNPKSEPSQAESLLREAANEILSLKRQNELMRARLDMFDAITTMLQIDYPRTAQGWMHPGPIENRIQHYLDTLHVTCGPTNSDPATQ